MERLEVILKFWYILSSLRCVIFPRMYINKQLIQRFYRFIWTRQALPEDKTMMLKENVNKSTMKNHSKYVLSLHNRYQRGSLRLLCAGQLLASPDSQHLFCIFSIKENNILLVRRYVTINSCLIYDMLSSRPSSSNTRIKQSIGSH